MHLEAVRARIALACKRAGRDPGEVGIVAVTKTHPIAAIREALDAGLNDIGENRVQEALAKQEAWRGGAVRWHLIGHLQRNKAKQAVGRFALIHSLDSIRLADALESSAAALGVTQDVLVQVNVAREGQKDGVDPDQAEVLVRHAGSLPHLALKGLMTMAPLTPDESVVRATFRGLRELRDGLRTGTGNGQPAAGAGTGNREPETRIPDGSPLPVAGFRLPVLSMGMSSDFEIAVEEGATLLRLGTVLFGERQP